MLNGLKALFTSGLIFDPMVLLGVIIGALFYWGLDKEQITAIYMDYRFYGLSGVVSVLYCFLWRPQYKQLGLAIDYQATSFKAVFGFLKIVIASLLMMSFISFFSFGNYDTDSSKVSLQKILLKK